MKNMNNWRKWEEETPLPNRKIEMIIFGQKCKRTTFKRPNGGVAVNVWSDNPGWQTTTLIDKKVLWRYINL
jgi:hypothetical protein